MPIEGMELTQLQFMHSIYKVIKDDDSLKKRMTYLGVWWRYRGFIKQLHNIFDLVWNSIEPEKRARINEIWSRQELRIVNAAAPVDPTGDLIMSSKEAITLWGQHCQTESCSMCMGNHEDRKDCKFRRGMVKMALPDLRRLEKKYGKCMGKIFDFNN